MASTTITKSTSSSKARSHRRHLAKKKQRVVTFMLDDEDIEQFEMYDNPEDIWFDRIEEAEFQQHSLQLVDRMVQKQIDPVQLEIQTGESPRGLEHLQCEVTIQKRRTQALEAVVEAQKSWKQQQQQGQHKRLEQQEDTIAATIAKAYQQICQTAMELARDTAKQEERFVLDHVRIAEPLEHRTFEKRCERPSVMGRQPGRRSLLNYSAA